MKKFLLLITCVFTQIISLQAFTPTGQELAFGNNNLYERNRDTRMRKPKKKPVKQAPAKQADEQKPSDKQDEAKEDVKPEPAKTDAKEETSSSNS